MGGQEKEWMRCFLDDLRAFFGINADQVDDCIRAFGLQMP